MRCRYIVRPPLANERLHLLADGGVTVEFKRPWSDGTRSIGLHPKALLSRMAALVPPPKLPDSDVMELEWSGEGEGADGPEYPD